MVKEDKFDFEKDEKVLCYHGPFIYEAKVTWAYGIALFVTTLTFYVFNFPNNRF